jgi:hypothetical protein
MLILSFQLQALTPMESLILGDLTEYYRKEKVDPLSYVFTMNERLESNISPEVLTQAREHLALYRGFYQEGQNLDNYCRRQPEMTYPTRFAKEQAIRSVMASLQYHLLDLSVRAIASYSKELNVTPSEYEALVNNMMGQYCSKNISIISLDQLKKNMMERYHGENVFQLPSIQNNPLFPEPLIMHVQGPKAREREFVQTLRLFKTACSWGGETDNKRLLPPLLRHPAIMAFIFRQLSSQRFVWNELDNTLRIVEDTAAVQVNCQNLVCRRVERDIFLRDFPRQVGSASLSDDLRRLYCHEFRDADYTVREQVPQLVPIIQRMSFDDQNFLVGQLIALVSGVPDFILHGESFGELRALAQSSMDRVWGDWAESQLVRMQNELYYEEPITIEVVDRTQFFDSFNPEFRVVLDVNLGEFDRINQRSGKLRSVFTVQLSRAFMTWAAREWVSESSELDEVRKEVLKRLSTKLRTQVEQARDQYGIAPWRGPVEQLIAREIMDQLMAARRVRGLLAVGDEAMLKIPIEVNFGPFALRYMHYRQQIVQNKEREERFRETHERLRTQGLGAHQAP